MGFPPGPTIPPNMQQRSNRSQNYHNFMDTSSNAVGNVAGGGGGRGMPLPPYMHYNRMSGGNPSANKKYHNPLNKTRSTKYPLPPQANTNESHHQQQHTTAHHQLHGHQQHHQLTSYSNTATVPSSLVPPTTTTNPQTAAINSSANLKILGHENRKQQPAPQAKSSDVYGLKKINENPRQLELNFQKANNERVVNEIISSVPATEDLPIKSMKTLSLAEKNTTTLDEKEDAAKITQSSGEKAEKAEETKTEKISEESSSTGVASEANDETNNNAAGGKESNDFKSSREKTPMCLVNDLARFNKISFQYRLTGENGPAHCKRFTVTLKLGDEEYMAEGFKIKEAQHMAAKEAILKTKYKHPIPKANRRNDEQGTSKVNVTPTVELNALAMKLGLQTYYIFDPRQSAQEGSGGGVGDKGKAMGQRFRGGPPTGGGHQPGGIPPTQLHGMGPNMKYGGGGAGTFVPNLAHHNPAAALMHVQQAAAAGHHHHRGGHYPACYPVLPPHMMAAAAAAQHHHANIFPTPCKITLIVGTQKFIGTGRTIQQAKHDAAAQAIEALKEEMNNQQKDNEEEKNDEEGDNKSPISMVFEIGIKRNLPVDFKILREDGPAHMRTFTTACIVGQIVTEAEGTGKKISKKKAAQKMLEELKKLPPIEPTTANANSPNKRAKGGGGGSGGKGLPGAARKSGGHTKPGADKKESGHTRGGQGDKMKKRERLDSSDVAADASNPITKLVEWCQHNKEKEPIFKIITEAGGKERARQRQFVVEVCTKDLTVRGVGNSKKSARRNAAQNMLLALGVDTTTSNSSEKTPQSAQKSDESTNNSSNEKSLKTASADFKNRDEEMERVKDTKAINITMKAEEEKKEEKPMVSSNTTTPAAAGSSAAAASTSVNPTVTSPSSVATTTTTTTPKSSSGLYMKDKLLYLAKLMGFEVDFSDYPKGNHNEFLSIVMISTNPPQICHGIGANAQESQEDAARNALKILSEMGLNK
uniref:Staufen n=1 Tax=Musca domestica TaxID=7370 RepID=Q9NHD2_MUSDO|nr:staufen [Musca domestica]